MTAAAKGSVMVMGPATPGATPTVLWTGDSTNDAWDWAQQRFADRPDVRYSDVTIQVGGKHVGYAGPAR